jgi:hypothetical protein
MSFPFVEKISLALFLPVFVNYFNELGLNSKWEAARTRASLVFLSPRVISSYDKQG